MMGGKLHFSFWTSQKKDPEYLIGVAASISKTAAAPIERVKLLIQNQGSMIEAGRLDKPYKGIVDCFARTYKDEGMISCKSPLVWSANS